MTVPTVTRRGFNSASLASLLAAIAASAASDTVAQAASGAAKRRDVIKQLLPGEPQREITMLEVTYPPGTGSPAHLHANGVMAYVVSGAIASQVGDETEHVYHAGEAWWEPTGAVHRVSRNASTSQPATLLAIYIAPKGAAAADLMKPL